MTTATAKRDAGAKPGPLDLYRPQPVKTIAALLEGQLHKIAAAIPAQVDAARFARLAVSMLNKRTELANCTARSLLQAIMESAQLGLELDPSLGHAYLVPFRAGNQTLAQLIVGYRGMIHLLIETGRVRKVYARPVWQGDKFEMKLGTNEHITHVPVRPDERTPNGLTGEPLLMGCYAVIEFTDGATAIDWMWAAEIEAIRARSRAGESGPWKTDYVEMAKKTVIRRLAKTSDASPKVTRVAAAEEARDAGIDVSLTDLTDAELVGLRTDERTKALEAKYSEQKGGDASVGKAAPETAKDPVSRKDGHTGFMCDAKHHDPAVHCELEQGHRSKVHQWVKPDDPSVPGVDDVPLPPEPGANG